MTSAALMPSTPLTMVAYMLITPSVLATSHLMTQTAPVMAITDTQHGTVRALSRMIITTLAAMAAQVVTNSEESTTSKLIDIAMVATLAHALRNPPLITVTITMESITIVQATDTIATVKIATQTHIMTLILAPLMVQASALMNLALPSAPMVPTTALVTMVPTTAQVTMVPTTA